MRGSGQSNIPHGQKLPCGPVMLGWEGAGASSSIVALCLFIHSDPMRRVVWGWGHAEDSHLDEPNVCEVSGRQCASLTLTCQPVTAKRGAPEVRVATKGPWLSEVSQEIQTNVPRCFPDACRTALCRCGRPAVIRRLGQTFVAGTPIPSITRAQANKKYIYIYKKRVHGCLRCALPFFHSGVGFLTHHIHPPDRFGTALRPIVCSSMSRPAGSATHHVGVRLLHRGDGASMVYPADGSPAPLKTHPRLGASC